MLNAENLGLKLGHARAEDAANNAGDEWKAIALAAFKQYAKQHELFTTEQVRLTVENVPAPPDARAWGSIARTAQAEGFILGDGWVRAESKTVHGMVVTRWKSKIYYPTHINGEAK